MCFGQDARASHLTFLLAGCASHEMAAARFAKLVLAGGSAFHAFCDTFSCFQLRHLFLLVILLEVRFSFEAADAIRPSSMVALRIEGHLYVFTK